MLISRPPGPNAGDMSTRTVALRPNLDLDEEQVVCARGLRRQGIKPSTIAEHLEMPVAAVERALLAMRTPKADRTRRSLNCTLAAASFVDRERQPGEAVHEVMDRLLRELEAFRGGSI